MILLEWQKEALEELWDLFKVNRELLEALKGDSRSGPYLKAATHMTLEFRDYASADAPYLTGTLASAHRGVIEPVAGGHEGTVFIDPHVINPIFGGEPAVYGEIVHVTRPWWDDVVNARSEELLLQAENIVLDDAERIWIS